MMKKSRIIAGVKRYRFEFRHLSILFLVLFIFQISASILNRQTLNNFSEQVLDWYKKDSAERFANITATSLEILVESLKSRRILSEEDKSKVIQGFNVILSPQSLQQRVQEISLLISKKGVVYSIKDGDLLYDFLYENIFPEKYLGLTEESALELYQKYHKEIAESEKIKTITTGDNRFHILVPFIIRGEYLGALYVKYIPDFRQITSQLSASYEGMGIVYSAMILIGFLGMYYLTSKTIEERDEVQKLLFEEHEQYLKEKIAHENENLFTKRIYHTHHKAEKIMGFIKNDIQKLPPSKETYRIMKYSNFISRVIYDMKWYEPQINTIRNPMFSTDLNEVIIFLKENIFERVSRSKTDFEIKLNLDKSLPPVSINEYVIWEIIEPLVQNAIDHAGVDDLVVTISTKYNHESKNSRIIISDNGKGISPELLKRNSEGIKMLFAENVTTKKESGRNRGYGCFLAYKMAKERCGWDIDVENLSGGGACFIISIKN